MRQRWENEVGSFDMAYRANNQFLHRKATIAACASKCDLCRHVLTAKNINVMSKIKNHIN